ncbi:hypothetical protein SEET0012_16884 [Salmonella enterica subsp. enterica serovar Tallahassee str. 0012]|nr:hypothetical protein SEET0012_16884 [Salmonella enterica subsp. enterica serovar Tallahassee str. 0012]
MPPNSGLSPLARGTLFYAHKRCRNVRFIPAGAGNTELLVGDTVELTVYPRWRGEHSSGEKILMSFFGLSPLARGTLSQPEAHFLSVRFIPAGAGNTLNVYNCL